MMFPYNASLGNRGTSYWPTYTAEPTCTTCHQGTSLARPTTLNDATKLVMSCKACQFHAKQIHQPAQGLKTVSLSWPFVVWGLDILGPFPRPPGGYRYIYVAIDKFTK